MDNMKFFDNIKDKVADDLRQTIKPGCRIAAAASSFSMYAFNELRKQLRDVQEFRFIFTSPEPNVDLNNQAQRSFAISKTVQNTDLDNGSFEIKMRGGLDQRSISRDCAEWIRAKAKFKAIKTPANIPGFMVLNSGSDPQVYTPLQDFTPAGLGCAGETAFGNMVNRLAAPQANAYLEKFNDLWNNKRQVKDVTEEVIAGISAAYEENSPENIYFLTLYHTFSNFLEDIASGDNMPNSRTGFKNSKIWGMLYDFQRDAVQAIINKLEKYNGCILADSVGLGKTFTTLAVIKYYLMRNRHILVLCPKKLEENWKTYTANYDDNILLEDGLRYDVLFHTDLSRVKGKSGDIDLEKFNWSNYDLLVIDESHNFRNGGAIDQNTGKKNRYQLLLDKAITPGVNTKVLMLSATPVNNRFLDLEEQLALAYKGDPGEIDPKLDTKSSITTIFSKAQQVFNEWSELEANERTAEDLLRRLDFDFFTVLDSLTIARSRKHIQKYYQDARVGSFPTRRAPKNIRPKLTDKSDTISYNDIAELLLQLKLSIYTPSAYIHKSKLYKYSDDNGNLTEEGRNRGLVRLMRANLLKRLESSQDSFVKTLYRIRNHHEQVLKTIADYETNKRRSLEATACADSKELADALDFEDIDSAKYQVGKNGQIDLDDMDYLKWRKDLQEDKAIFDLIAEKMSEIVSASDIAIEDDVKLAKLRQVIEEKLSSPINPGNKKILIFSAFAETAEYIYAHIAPWLSQKYGLHSAIITGTGGGKSTVKGLKGFNNILTNFSPKSKGKPSLSPDKEIDLLVATDCISEGQNLQDCDYLINFDIHWNPVRIIQRFGRIDRIGSQNKYIQMVNFWPDVELDDYINLVKRVNDRMTATNMVATGDENPLDPKENSDLEYRLSQLEKLQNEVIDLEDMSGSISITDLGLNEFRADLQQAYENSGDKLLQKPFGLHSVAAAAPGCPPGVIFVLKNCDESVTTQNQNLLHPFYIVYISCEGKMVYNYTQPKQLLDTLRQLCRGRSEPQRELYEQFNLETDNGRNMRPIADLLGKAVTSIISAKENADIDSLFSSGGTTALQSEISGLDNFELICFLVVK